MNLYNLYVCGIIEFHLEIQILTTVIGMVVRTKPVKKYEII